MHWVVIFWGAGLEFILFRLIIGMGLPITRVMSTLQADRVIGLQATVLVLDPPKLVCRVLFGSYPHG